MNPDVVVMRGSMKTEYVGVAARIAGASIQQRLRVELEKAPPGSINLREMCDKRMKYLAEVAA